MDIQRVLIMVGLAVTSYMLILAWNEDYYQGSTQTTEESVVVNDAYGTGDILPTMSEPTSMGFTDIIALQARDDVRKTH